MREKIVVFARRMDEFNEWIHHHMQECGEPRSRNDYIYVNVCESRPYFDKLLSLARGFKYVQVCDTNLIPRENFDYLNIFLREREAICLATPIPEEEQRRFYYRGTLESPFDCCEIRDVEEEAKEIEEEEHKAFIKRIYGSTKKLDP